MLKAMSDLRDLGYEAPLMKTWCSDDDMYVIGLNLTLVDGMLDVNRDPSYTNTPLWRFTFDNGACLGVHSHGKVRRVHGISDEARSVISDAVARATAMSRADIIDRLGQLLDKYGR